MRRRVWRILGGGVGLGLWLCLWPSPVSADLLDDLRQRLFERRQAVQKIEEQIGAYQQSLQGKRREALTLQSQIDIIEDSVAALTLAIDKTNAEIEAVTAELAAVKEEIRRTEAEIEQRKQLLRLYLRELQTLDTNSTVEVLLKYPSLSHSLMEMRAIYRVEKDGQEQLDRIQKLREELRGRATAFTDLQRELDVLRARQTTQKATLVDQRGAKKRLLEITRAQEAGFRQLLSATVEEQRRADAEIRRLDVEIRRELERQGLRRLGSVGRFEWPIDPIFGVACGFHCPDYPFRALIGPHTGIDIPTSVGTPIRSPADGYVARVHIASGPGYSYILLIHGDELSTVYGHLTAASVAEGSYVTRGQVIGSTGGAPGMRGAGLSTGPHLHFEVRKNGIPTDPLQFLAPVELTRPVSESSPAPSP